MIGFTELTDQKMVGSPLPWWQGVAYRRPELRSTVLAPIPLNWMIGKARNWYWRLLQGPGLSKVDEKIEQALWAQRNYMMEISLERKRSDTKLQYRRGWNDAMKQVNKNVEAFLEERKKR